ncbi:transmembrane protein 223-like isoform X2 [Haliotis rufescens]|uniref:transmembrane protein 223-like isoform X1 n=1 Tax=Haliotis rufescens TaxID=6454 RepID=UPI001EB08856|nr:transmembrane protein 223-like isoform X1 [Haliotis rufescens]XP_048258926.1 transmembrane protein 223-like isoform X2 [Haliotis rufescens]
MLLSRIVQNHSLANRLRTSVLVCRPKIKREIFSMSCLGNQTQRCHARLLFNSLLQLGAKCDFLPKTSPRTIISRHKSYKTKPKTTLPFEVDSNVSKDVLVYSFSGSRFYKLITLFGASQFIFWMYLSIFSFSNLKDISQEDEDKQLGIKRDDSLVFKVLMPVKGYYKTGLGFLFLSVGSMVLFICWIYPQRAVNQLWLLKGGKGVQISTYTWFGNTRSFSSPLNHLSCLQSRTSSSSQISMKVKHHWFHFLLDKKGIFHNTELFDHAVGLQRNLKK